MRRIMLLTAAIALIAAGCKIETNVAATINADGSGTVTVEMGLDQEAMDAFTQMGEGDPFADIGDSGIPNATTHTETRGDMTYYVVEAEVDDITTLEDQIVNNENSLLDSFDITITPDRVSVEGSADAGELAAEAGGFDPSVLADSVSANLRITLPGRILSSNADSQDGNTLTWAIPIVGGTLDIQAESNPNESPAGGGFPIWLIVLIAVIVLGAIAFFVIRGRSGGSAAPQFAGTGAPADAAAPPPPPPPAE